MLYAGVIADASGRAMLAIAQETDGSPALVACYTQLIPADADTRDMQLEVHGGMGEQRIPEITLVLHKHADGGMDYVRFYGDGAEGWRLGILLGMLDGEVYSLHAYPEGDGLDLSRHGDTHGYTSAPMSVLDPSRQGLSFNGALAAARACIDEAKYERISAMLERLQASFPGEDWTDATLVDWYTFEENGLRSATAVVDRAERRTFYQMEDLAGASVSFSNDRLIPREAEHLSLYQSIAPMNRESRGYIGFTLDGCTYQLETIRDDAGRSAIFCFSSESAQQERWYLELQSGCVYSLRMDGISSYSNPLIELPPELCALETADMLSVPEWVRRGHETFLSGEAPIIPSSQGDFAIPQPSGMALTPGVYPVYSGPGETYYREADGKACVSADDWVQVFGRENGWLLIQYRVSGALLRFGYIPQSACADDPVFVPELSLEGAPICQDNGFVTSNPLGMGGLIDLTGQDYPMTRLAVMGDFWMYVELTLPNGKPARMFTEIIPSHG